MNHSKKTIHVLIHIGKTPLATRISENKYSGLCYDQWSIIRDKLQSNYNFIEFPIQTTNGNVIIQLLKDNTYQLAISNFGITYNRLDDILFTRPILLNQNCIMYIPKVSLIHFYLNRYFFNTIGFPLIVLLLLCVIIGLIHHKYLHNISSKITILNYINNAILSITRTKNIASKNENIPFFSICIILFISLFSFMIVNLIHSFYTNNLINTNKIIRNQFKVNNMMSKHFICPTGYPVGAVFKKFGAKITHIDGSIQTCIDTYIKNQDKYDGVTLGYYDSLNYLHINKKLQITKNNSQYGNVLGHWLLNRENTKLLSDMNDQMELENKSFSTICQKYLDKHCFG